MHPPVQILKPMQRWSALRLQLAELCAGLLLAALPWLAAVTQSQQPELHGLSQLRLSVLSTLNRVKVLVQLILGQ